jgi:flavorubredoxin
MNHKNSYSRPVAIAENVFWVGFHDVTTNLHCNPYLIIEDNQAVLIDAGSRPDFPIVMMKVLQTGIFPEQIVALIYDHVDPDLCGSMSNVVDICMNPELKILSHSSNNTFLSYYLEKDKRHLLKAIDEYGGVFTLGNRTLKFIQTPYAHQKGSFVTYDESTGIVFSGDLFGSFSRQWELFLNFDDACYTCTDYNHCKKNKMYCPLPDILDFHKVIIPSEKALRHAMKEIAKYDIRIIAPQHGSVLREKNDIDFLINKLSSLQGVGIDGLED